MNRKFSNEHLRACTDQINKILIDNHTALKLDSAVDCADFDTAVSCYMISAVIMALTDLSKISRENVTSAIFLNINQMVGVADPNVGCYGGTH